MSKDTYNLAVNIFKEVEEDRHIDLRHPLRAPWGNEGHNTRTQKIALNFLEDRRGTGPLIAMLGAKASGKTHFGGAFATLQAQWYPKSMGCLISNTYTQAKDNGGKLLTKIAKQCNISVEFFREKKIDGEPFSSLFVLDLDGTGFDGGMVSYVLVRSFDAIKKLEGIELDWLWVEEVQDAPKDAFVTVVSRVRGANADNAIFVAGMPDAEFHWMYQVLPDMGFDEARYGNFDPETSKGVLFEPAIFENRQNIANFDQYLDRLETTHGYELAQRYIHGERMALTTNKVAPSFDSQKHQKGRMSHLLCKYDPARKLVLSIDFNVSPFCVTLWQVKEWADEWDGDAFEWDMASDQWYYEGDEIESPAGVVEPYRQVLAQVDEFELWNANTKTMLGKVLSIYKDHTSGWTILGDATGDRRITSSSSSDWQQIGRAFADLPNVTIIKGLIQNTNLKTGVTKYSNPMVRDTLNVLDKVLLDGKKRVSMCFLPYSALDSGSGGAARSVAMMERTGDGKIDDSNDRKGPDDKSVPRTHFFDTVRYVAWWFNGGDLVNLDDFEDQMNSLEETVTLGGNIDSDFHGDDDWFDDPFDRRSWF